MKNQFLLKIALIVVFAGTSVISLKAQVTWSQLNDMPIHRSQAMAFSIGTKGYIVGGLDQSINHQSSLWEWDQVTDVWVQKASLPNSVRISGVAFSIGNKGYVTTGYDSGMFRDLWEWDPITDIWTQKSNLPAMGRGHVSCFVIDTKAYLAGGIDSVYNDLDEFWEWDQTTGAWTQRANLPSAIFNGAAFSIGNKGYVVSGHGSGSFNDKLWEWDQSTDVWIQRANLPAIRTRTGGIAFSYNNKGYITTGRNGAYMNDLMEWDQSTNTWISLTSLPGPARSMGVGYIMNNKAYILGGATGATGILDDMWEVDLGMITTVKEIKSEETLTVFPNPARDVCSIQFNEVLNLVEIRITDILGNVHSLQQRNFNELGNLIKINTKDLVVGTYILHIKTDKRNYTKKLTIQG